MSLPPIYCDHDSGSDDLIEQLPKFGIDGVAARDFGHERLSDEEQLLFATSLGRAIYTANAPDFAKLHKEWIASERHHAGIIIRTDQSADVGSQLRALLVRLGPYEATGIADLILYV